MKQKLADKLQQQEIVHDTAPHLIVEARAGTGKTTVLIEGLKILKSVGLAGTKAEPSGWTDEQLAKMTPLRPSVQQRAVWESIYLSAGVAKTICFVAFNKTIAAELKRRVPEGVDAMTMHSMGLRALRAYLKCRPTFGVLHPQSVLGVNQYRVREIISGIGLNNRPRLLLTPEEMKPVERLVSLCKMNLVLDGVGTATAGYEESMRMKLEILASQYDVDLNGNEREVFDLVPRVLERCKDVARDGCVDFDDMIWLPIVLDLDVYRYDLLLVDEAQDLNRCQQQLALKAGRRLILIGDPKQAIYGFAGADSKSMARMEEILAGNTYCMSRPSDQRHHWDCVGVDSDFDEYCMECGTPKPEVLDKGCTTLPLTITYRCGRAIVEEARKIVPDIETHESCCDGFVTTLRFEISASDEDCSKTKDGSHYYNMVHGKDTQPTCIACGCAHKDVLYYLGFVNPGDMVLCRVNAPLVSECFKFIRQGRKATIRGRDIGRGLVSTICKMKADTPANLRAKLAKWYTAEVKKERAKRYPNESRLVGLQDRYVCLNYFLDGSTTVQNVINRIQTIFSDDQTDTGILLSSIHKAKGLEAKRVFLLEPEGAQIPHPMAHTPEQIEQEWNLKYVAITRSREELVYVT